MFKRLIVSFSVLGLIIGLLFLCVSLTSSLFATIAGYPMRFVYLQHAGDPMVFFSPSLAVRGPDWLREPRGRDVSEYFDWFPLVTFLQVGFDVPMSTFPPSGYGHSYDALEYIEGWCAVPEPGNWSDDAHERLRELFTGFSATPI